MSVIHIDQNIILNTVYMPIYAHMYIATLNTLCQNRFVFFYLF